MLDVPEAVRRDLMRFMPSDDLPARLKAQESRPRDQTIDGQAGAVAPDPAARMPAVDRRALVWTFIREAPAQSYGSRVGEATAAVTPWPHQVRAFERLYAQWPPKLLIADEVGLGKTNPGGDVAAASVAGRAGAANSHPGSKGGAAAVADRATREVQSQLADLRRPQTVVVPLARSARGYEREVDPQEWVVYPFEIANLARGIIYLPN